MTHSQSLEHPGRVIGQLQDSVPTQHTTNTRQTCMPAAGFEPAIPTIKQQQTNYRITELQEKQIHKKRQRITKIQITTKKTGNVCII